MNKNQIILLTALIIGTLTSATLIEQDTGWKAPAEAKELINPKPGDKKSIKAGATLYKTYCVACHGKSGKGDGPGSKALNPKPADHTSKRVQSQVDGEIYWKIFEGKGGMIAWGKMIKEENIWDLVNYVRTLDASK